MYEDAKLPKGEKEHWQQFIKIHSPKTVNYVYSILGDKVEEKEFYDVYHNFHPKGKIGNHYAKKLFSFIKKVKWIK